MKSRARLARGAVSSGNASLIILSFYLSQIGAIDSVT